jgi:hypothetical protein
MKRKNAQNAVTIVAVKNAALKGHNPFDSDCSPNALRRACSRSDVKGDAIPGIAIFMPSLICMPAGRSAGCGNIGPCPEHIVKPKLPAGASASSMTTLDNKARDIKTANTNNSRHREIALPRNKKWRG